MDQSILDFNKIKSIKEIYPEDFRQKLEKNYVLLEEKIKKLKKAYSHLKKENSRLKDQIS